MQVNYCPKQAIDTSKWVSKNCFDYSKLKLVNDQITPVDCFYADVFSSAVLKTQFKFVIKLKKINGYVGIGIANKLNRPLETISDNYIIYDYCGGVIENHCKVNSCVPFDVGDTISVSGDLKEGKLKWEINEKEVCIHYYKTVSEPNSKWLSYIKISNESVIEIIFAWPEIQLIPIEFSLYKYEWDEDLLYEINSLLKLIEF